MGKLIIHAGYHKTGTTFINRKFFAKHADIHHLGKPYSEDSPIRELVDRLLGEKPYDPVRCKKLYDEFILPIQTNKIIIISDGRIIKQNDKNSPKPIPERILDLTEEVRVIVVIRKQYEYLKSLYVQHIGSNNEKRSFDEWFDSNWLKGSMLKSRLDYFVQIKIYFDILGRDKVGIFLYEQLRDDHEQFVNNLCNFIGCNVPKADNQDENTRPLNQRMTNLHRLINKNSAIYFVVKILKKIIPKKLSKLISNSVFYRFNRYEPELSINRKKIVQEHAHTVNQNLLEK